MSRPPTLAEVARRVSAGAVFGPTLSEFLDEFYMHPERRAAMIADEPIRLGHLKEDPQRGTRPDPLRGARPRWVRITLLVGVVAQACFQFVRGLGNGRPLTG